MGGNRTYTRFFIVTATRNVINNYNGNTLTGTNYGSWESASNNLSCRKEEKQTADCSSSYTGYIEPPPVESSSHSGSGGFVFMYYGEQTPRTFSNGHGGITTVYTGIDSVNNREANMYVGNGADAKPFTKYAY